MNVESYSTTLVSFSITPRAGFCSGAWATDAPAQENEEPKKKRYHLSPNNMRVLREALGLTQDACAVRAKIASTRWSAIERGRHTSKPTARRIARALGAKPSEVFFNFSLMRP